MSKASPIDFPLRDQRDRPFWLSWAVATVLGEFFGFGLVSLLALQVQSDAALPAVFLLAGLLEGTCLGAAQAWVLRRYLPNAIAWIPATAGGALLCWGLGMLPSTLMPMLSDGNEPMPEPGLGVVMLAAIAMGFALGALLGFVQWFVLKRHLRRAWRWIYGSAIAWALALPLSFIGPSLVQPGDSMGRIVGLAVLSGGGMGAIAGGIGGLALQVILRDQRLPEGRWDRPS